MKKKIVKKIQQVLIDISLQSVGKSIPASIYEKEIPKAVINSSHIKAK